ncbi:hypothetical protein [Dendronalium sp. ChiSLP03b]|uniref:hypothetical protein n=1 Tax=Dendronalium sp. ChiSLP03b TaxID=3075381 RepID=UPI00391D6EB2
MLLFHKSRFARVKTLKDSSAFDYNYYNIFWKCVQNMHYLDFCQASISLMLLLVQCKA